MSSEFYAPSLSRNLVRTGGAGYRENASLRLLLKAAEETAVRQDRDTCFSVFPDFGVQTDVLKRAVPAGRIRLSKSILSFGKHSLTGPPSP